MADIATADLVRSNTHVELQLKLCIHNCEVTRSIITHVIISKYNCAAMLFFCTRTYNHWHLLRRLCARLCGGDIRICVSMRSRTVAASIAGYFTLNLTSANEKDSNDIWCIFKGVSISHCIFRKKIDSLGLHT